MVPDTGGKQIEGTRACTPHDAQHAGSEYQDHDRRVADHYAGDYNSVDLTKLDLTGNASGRTFAHHHH